ncbi:MAG: endonuclease/exonuclease/phosphatase family protein [Parvularculaceae bacterium]
MRFLNYNIQAGIGTRNLRDYLLRAHHQLTQTKVKSATLASIAQLIAEYDIVCLQEVDLGGWRSGFQNQAATLQKMSGLPHMITQTNRVIGKFSLHGNAILSKHKIELLADTKLPGKVKGRGLLIGRIDGLVIANTHLSLGLKDQNLQFAAIAEQLRAYDQVIFSGDLNCKPASPHFTDFRELTQLRLHTHHHHPTFPSWKPRHALDHILATQELTISDCRPLQHALSDHLPVEALLKI